MTKISTKELIICVVAVITLILAFTTNVFATTPSLNDLLNDANNEDKYNTIPGENNTANNTANNIVNNSVNNTANNIVNNSVNNTANNIVNNSVNNTANNAATNNNNLVKNNTNRNNTTIPAAGLDQSIVFIIAIFGVSAIYAYKKIRDYKNV